MNSLKLHHVAIRITPGSLEKVTDLFKLLGCKISHQPENERWVMVAQDGLKFDIQVCEVDGEHRIGAKRVESHIGFISEDPHGEVEKLKEWAANNSVKHESGSWDEKMLWIDFPELFQDFVIEIMHSSVEDV